MVNLLPTSETDAIWAALAQVEDPEIPVLSVLDLGIVRDVQTHSDGVMVTITPTYSGCPAMDTIASDIKKHLETKGFAPVTIKQTLNPPWSSAWISDAGRQKLRAYGIAPPDKALFSKKSLFAVEPEVMCPRCGSEQTKKVSEFGSTPCKAHYQCRSCLEPFDYFKCI